MGGLHAVQKVRWLLRSHLLNCNERNFATPLSIFGPTVLLLSPGRYPVQPVPRRGLTKQMYDCYYPKDTTFLSGGFSSVPDSGRGQFMVRGCSVFRSPAITEGGGTDPGSRGLLASARALLRFGSRVLGGPGEAGTG
jgi:hypothetical protein